MYKCYLSKVLNGKLMLFRDVFNFIYFYCLYLYLSLFDIVLYHQISFSFFNSPKSKILKSISIKLQSKYVIKFTQALSEKICTKV